MATKALSVSEARRQMCALVERVSANAGEKVVIARRGRQSGVVMVNAGYLRSLEAKPTAPPVLGNGRRPFFHMAGTLRVLGDPDTVIEDIRARQNQLHKAKVERYSGLRRK